MAESSVQNKPTEKDVLKKDEYLGGYKDRAQTASEEEKFGGNQNPSISDPLPAKNLRAGSA
jgi:hypothetical protein